MSTKTEPERKEVVYRPLGTAARAIRSIPDFKNLPAVNFQLNSLLGIALSRVIPNLHLAAHTYDCQCNFRQHQDHTGDGESVERRWVYYRNSKL
ncbi:hypothetical protein DFH07DRAFT_974572 [Mycena maculata]|uniref:Uncharacterized protein n=1 Tax=Mycena maculata TaxID=230809 RepID=A0AAD7H7P7_9AGAR|nr:hypothetical protein DFH07DRAFT_974572 [Mycena maculata]